MYLVRKTRALTTTKGPTAMFYASFILYDIIEQLCENIHIILKYLIE